MDKIYFAAFIGFLYAGLGFFLKGLYSRYKSLFLMRETLKQCVNELLIKLPKKPKEQILMQPNTLESYIPFIIESETMMALYQDYRDYYTEWKSDYYLTDNVVEYNKRLGEGKEKLTKLIGAIDNVELIKLYVFLRLT